jgi:hypothetical protein
MSTTRLVAELGRSGWRFDDLLPDRPAWHTKASCRRAVPVLSSPDDRRGAGRLNQVTRAACPVAGPNARRPATTGTTALGRHVCQGAHGGAGLVWQPERRQGPVASFERRPSQLGPVEPARLPRW